VSDVDLAIVGGGPAGLATAIGARLAGLTVRLFDRAMPPIDKACGEGLMPDGVHRLQDLGIQTANLGRPFAGIRYLAEGLEAEGHFPTGLGEGIRRTTLHTAMVERADQTGATLHWGCSVEGIEEHTLRTSDGSFSADWIVGADGLHSRVRHWLGIPVTLGRPRFGIRRHFEIEPWSDLVEVYWGNDCEAYVTPVSQRQVGVAVLRGSTKQRFDSLLDGFPRLATRLESARPCSRDRGYGPLWSVPASVQRGHVALVGDAAGYLDAITGEGLSLSLHQSRALIRAIASGSAESYQKSARQLARWPGALIRALLFVEKRPRLRNRLIRTLAADRQLFSKILGVHARQLRPRELNLLDAGRLLLGLAISG
jgi:flavin-dependent dehydrogenase